MKNNFFDSGLLITNDETCQEDAVYITESDWCLNPENRKAVKEGEEFEIEERQIIVEKY